MTTRDNTTTGAPTGEDLEFVFKYDGMEYVGRTLLNGLDTVKVRKWTEGTIGGGAALLRALDDGDAAAWACVVTLAMQRRGIKADFYKIADDHDIIQRIEFVKPDDADDAVPFGGANGDGSSRTT